VLLTDVTPREEVYVELKGSDIFHAVVQLRAAIIQLSADHARLRKRCYAFSGTIP
jgi:hypothetical protein